VSSLVELADAGRETVKEALGLTRRTGRCGPFKALRCGRSTWGRPAPATRGPDGAELDEPDVAIRTQDPGGRK